MQKHGLLTFIGRTELEGVDIDFTLLSLALGRYVIQKYRDQNLLLLSPEAIGLEDFVWAIPVVLIFLLEREWTSVEWGLVVVLGLGLNRRLFVG